MVKEISEDTADQETEPSAFKHAAIVAIVITIIALLLFFLQQAETGQNQGRNVCTSDNEKCALIPCLCDDDCRIDLAIKNCGEYGICQDGACVPSCEAAVGTPCATLISCGNGECDEDETCITCPEECCSPTCKNQKCDCNENCINCPFDCGPCTSTCGNDRCAINENCVNCPGDCGACWSVCPDGVCGPGETYTNNPFDCPSYCGDGWCGPGETLANCPDDCTSTGYCGDGRCSSGETCTNCQADCGPCTLSYCGDGVCSGTESCQTCIADCGTCATGYCGDESCAGSETCTNCPADCGPCAGCVPNCGSYMCGLDPLCHTQNCGNCPQGQACTYGVCVAGTCTPNCNNKECGTDGCTGTCPPGCAVGEYCINGLCLDVPGGNCDNDGTCDPGETHASCPNDCPICNNDGSCDTNSGENPTNCPNDCPPCIPEGYCDTAYGENHANCPADCAGYCGDQDCDTGRGETCTNCATDCGSCPGNVCPVICNNECSPSGKKICIGDAQTKNSAYIECKDWDDDNCLEWGGENGGITQCPSSASYCVHGTCVPCSGTACSLGGLGDTICHYYVSPYVAEYGYSECILTASRADPTVICPAWSPYIRNPSGTHCCTQPCSDPSECFLYTASFRPGGSRCSDECPEDGYRTCIDDKYYAECEYARPYTGGLAPEHGDVLYWKLPVACKTWERCVDGQCVNICNDECTRGEKECVSGSNCYQVCGNYDADPCMDWARPAVCATGKTCVDGSCV